MALHVPPGPAQGPTPPLLLPSGRWYSAGQVARLWPSWAACRHAGPEVFYSTRPGSRRQAESLCGRCPVLEVCLWSAVVEEDADGYHFGFRGGLTAAGRSQILGVVGSDIARRRLAAALSDLAAGPGARGDRGAVA